MEHERAMTHTDHSSLDARQTRALTSLAALAVGDAFGERFFAQPAVWMSWVEAGQVSAPRPWLWTDDTAMAMSIVEILIDHDEIDADALAGAFAHRYAAEPWRGYGGGAHRLLQAICQGARWQDAAGSLFDGQGSFGNGGAMRAGPLGAYFADASDDLIVAQAEASARVTHANVEGVAGAVAIAMAAASLWRTREAGAEAARAQLWADVLTHTPAGWTRDNLDKAHNTPRDAHLETAVARLGNGTQVAAFDTVPLCVWLMARHIDDMEAALWETATALGDRDTTCAIVSSALAMRAPETLPESWQRSTEPLSSP